LSKINLGKGRVTPKACMQNYRVKQKLPIQKHTKTSTLEEIHITQKIKGGVCDNLTLLTKESRSMDAETTIPKCKD
jgi:hypothetical protein